MINEVNGLPTHILLVHAVVVLIPLAALLTVLAAVWPAGASVPGCLSRSQPGADPSLNKADKSGGGLRLGSARSPRRVEWRIPTPRSAAR